MKEDFNSHRSCDFFILFKKKKHPQLVNFPQKQLQTWQAGRQLTLYFTSCMSWGERRDTSTAWTKWTHASPPQMPFNLLYMDAGGPFIQQFESPEQGHERREEGSSVFTGCECGRLTYKLCDVGLYAHEAFFFLDNRLNSVATCSSWGAAEHPNMKTVTEWVALITYFCGLGID